MESDSELFERVRAFVARETGYPFQKVSLETRLAWDIGMAGDDAVQFFEAFIQEFGVDRKSFGGLNFCHHFGTESSLPPFRCFLVLGLLMLIDFILVNFLAAPFTVVLVVSLPLLFLLTCIRWWRQANFDRSDPGAIRVRDVVSAAAAKRWVKT